MIKTINKNKETVILHCLLMYQNQSLKFKFTYVELCRPPTTDRLPTNQSTTGQMHRPSTNR